ncbi:hypothetical protein [Desulfovibrio litoralis]|uniref:Uncharacterized protein n=1 Tax=Desulfovibrio litoralis DSM 11393 TaxID=1121455 RepID=A0A1M7TKB4_9BACT|nr:hypothetical protein [Desulfovibrio litoralis]SHN71167.1 hypothetical protein SAMN02745728_02155 [Desulfovibrio litoralis DSM 11393]
MFLKSGKYVVILSLFLFLQACSGRNLVPAQGNFNSGTEPSVATSSEFGTVIRVGQAEVLDPLVPRSGIIGATTNLIFGRAGTIPSDGIELTVQMDSGELVTVMQYNDEYFEENDRVRVVYNPDGSARALH